MRDYHFFENFSFELIFIIFSFFYFFSNIIVFFSNYPIKILFTKLFGKKYFSKELPAFKSTLKSYWTFFLSFTESLKFYMLNLNAEDLIGAEPLSHGWLNISLIPFKDPIRWRGFFTSKPLINDFTYFDIIGVFGNFGSECMIAMKISSFFGA